VLFLLPLASMMNEISFLCKAVPMPRHNIGSMMTLS
jgi:hypothetical protein